MKPLPYRSNKSLMDSSREHGGTSLLLDVNMMNPITFPTSSGAARVEDGGNLSPATMKLIDEVCQNAEINTPDIKDIESLTFPSAARLQPSGHFENSFQLNEADFGSSNDMLFGTDPLLSTPLKIENYSTEQNDMYIHHNEYQPEFKEDYEPVLDYLYGEDHFDLNASPPTSEIPAIASPSNTDGNILNQAVEISGITEQKEPLYNWEVQDISNINVLEDVDTQFSEVPTESSNSYTTLQQLSPPQPSPIFLEPSSESLFNGFNEPEPVTPKRTRKPPQRYSDAIVIEESIEHFDEEVTVNIEEPPQKRTKFSLKGLSEAEKYRRIREQNNAASKKCRSKRKEDMQKKTLEMEALQEENRKLKRKYDALKRKLEVITIEWQKARSNEKR